MTDDELDQYAGKVHRHDAWVITRVIVLIAFVVALVVLAFDNRDEVRIGYVFGSVDAPVWVVLLIAMAVGLLIGWLLRFRRRS
jgi:uncharacterized integral membrane protein